MKSVQCILVVRGSNDEQYVSLFALYTKSNHVS